MAMFSGEVRTYHDVRMMVVATYGPLDEQSELLFMLALGNALDQMWADLKENPVYLTEWEISAGEGGYVLPAGIAKICSARGTFVPEDEDDPEIPDVQYQLHSASCSAGSGDCEARNEVTWGCSSTAVTTAQVGATAIVPDGDPPATVVVVGYRKPGPPFFVEITVDDEPCRVWNDIDLPEIFRNVYAKAVIGMVFFMSDDAPRGADWLNLAQGEFSQLKRANPGLVTGTARERGMYQMGAKRYLSPTSCCELGGDWWRAL